MGCACSKGILPNEHRDNKSKLRKTSNRFVSSFKRDEVVVQADGNGNDATALLTSSPSGGGGTDGGENEGEKKVFISSLEKSSKAPQRMGTMDSGASGGQGQMLGQSKVSSVGRLPHGDRGALVVAGWPSWLSSVAGEAINGWIPRSADSFEKLEKIGQGTYSSVYKARDLETNRLVALKKVRFANMDPESVRFMAREIVILRRLNHPNIMKLEALITSRASGSVSLVFEYMEHDLTGLAASPGVKFSEAQVKCYMQQLLQGLEHCHKHGVLHRDIKGANLLIDNNGTLKIGDFGLATSFKFHSQQKQPLTSRVVTLWYRPPELLLGSTDYGPSVDLWSAGCILAELFVGKPIMPGRTEVEQLHKIFKLCGSPSEEYWKKSKLPHATIFKPQQPYNRCLAETFKDFPSSTLALLDVLLAVEPDHRGSSSSALQHEFFTTNPLPLDPSSLPKYPPSKEFDAKLRDEENRRRKAASKGRGHESFRKNFKESQAVPAPDANAELAASIQKRQGQNNPKSTSEKYSNKEEEKEEEDGGSASRRIIDHVKEDEVLVVLDHPNGAMDSSNLIVKKNKKKRGYMNGAAAGAQLSKFSSSVAVRGTSSSSSSHLDGLGQGQEGVNGRYNHLGCGESSSSSRGNEWSHHLLVRPNSSYKKDQEKSNNKSTMVYSPVKNHLHCSGPLLRPGGNMEEMLKEHEKQIRNAVRKAHLDKAKTKKDHPDDDNRFTETESFLQNTQNVRL